VRAPAVPTVVIATTSERRVRAWTVLLDSVTPSRRSANQLHVEVATCPGKLGRAGWDGPSQESLSSGSRGSAQRAFSWVAA
jgi:hypothetical protein